MTSGLAGIVAVVRNLQGKVLDGANIKKRVTGVLAAEAEVVRLGVILANKNGWREVIIKSDSKILVKQIHQVDSPMNI